MPWMECPPTGFPLPDGTRRGRILAEGETWQIVMTSAESPALLVSPALHARWVEEGISGTSLFVSVHAEEVSFLAFMGKKGYLISSIQQGPYPQTSTEARAFAIALRKTRRSVEDASFHDALYLEQFSLLLPTYTQIAPFNDATVLGTWLSAGVHIPATSLRRLCKLLDWMPAHEVQAIVKEAGFLGDSDTTAAESEGGDGGSPSALRSPQSSFSLPGRPELEAFFNEHIVEVVRNEERYLKMGISFPSAVVLYGPPGSGKTFAVERLVKFLGWPCYAIDSGSIGSPYIHDTSRKTAELFEEAMRNAPSVVVIDEMEAFLSDRMTQNTGLHHVEEVAEFLRRIPEASRNRVLIVAMTNRLDAIDPAVLRRGRFDHVVEVKMPSAEEVRVLLSSLLDGLPMAEDVALDHLAEALAGHPLSDVAFVVKEAGRVSAKEGKDTIDAEAIKVAWRALSQRGREARRVGF